MAIAEYRRANIVNKQSIPSVQYLLARCKHIPICFDRITIMPDDLAVVGLGKVPLVRVSEVVLLDINVGVFLVPA